MEKLLELQKLTSAETTSIGAISCSSCRDTSC